MNAEELLQQLQAARDEIENERQLRLQAEDERSRLKVSSDKPFTMRAARLSPCIPPLTLARLIFPTTAPMQRARDELAKTVLALEHRAAEAEEEAARLRQELSEARETAAVASPPSPLPADDGTEDIHSQRLLRSDVELLLKELDAEKKAYRKLEKVASTAQRDAAKAQERLATAKVTIKALKKGKAPPSAPVDSDNEEETVAQLQSRITALKNARDRLIEALDGQAAESERLGSENAALAEAAAETRDAAARWEAQAQEALTQSSRLKDLLEESAQWSFTSGGDGGGGVSEGGANQGQAAVLEVRLREAEREVLAQQARAAGLEVQVRALCAELTRVVAHSAALHRAAHPLLGDVEARLTNMVADKGRLRAALAGAEE